MILCLKCIRLLSWKMLQQFFRVELWQNISNVGNIARKHGAEVPFIEMRLQN